MPKKQVNWSSPKEYQTNRVIRNPHKRKPRQFCKPLKSAHTMVEVERHNTIGLTFITFKCTACGHKETEIIYGK